MKEVMTMNNESKNSFTLSDEVIIAAIEMLGQVLLACITKWTAHSDNE